MGQDFISHYLAYTDDSECPVLFSRWAALSMIGALLGRQYNLDHGHFPIQPNIYAMLVGLSGSRKSTTIKIAKKIIQLAGHKHIAADKSTKEKFLLDLAGESNNSNGGPNGTDIMEQFLWGADSQEDREMYIMADEFNVFIGNGNIEFLSLLGVLWDHDGAYENRIKNGKSISINNPTINILAGNTATGINLLFPPEAITQGIFSRLLFVNADPRNKQISKPKMPAPEWTKEIVEYLVAIKKHIIGKATLTPEADLVLDAIYKAKNHINDVRFESYWTRRQGHLLKLCINLSAARLSKVISFEDVIYANTILSYTEHSMPKALGEFGKSKNSGVTDKVLQVIKNALKDNGISFGDIWKHVSNDLEGPIKLSEIVKNLQMADKILAAPITVNGTKEFRFLPKVQFISDDQKYVDYGMLTTEEKGLVNV